MRSYKTICYLKTWFIKQGHAQQQIDKLHDSNKFRFSEKLLYTLFGRASAMKDHFVVSPAN